jgi:hypothetical protein
MGSPDPRMAQMARTGTKKLGAFKRPVDPVEAAKTAVMEKEKQEVSLSSSSRASCCFALHPATACEGSHRALRGAVGCRK